MTRTSPPGRSVLRTGSGPWLLGAFAAVCAWLVIDAFARGYAEQTWPVVPWVLLAVWVVYLLFVRPCVIVDDEAVTVVNVLRSVVAPWGSVRDVTFRFQIRLLLRDGRAVRAWGGPTIGLDRALRRDAENEKVGADRGARAADEIGRTRRLFYAHMDAAGAPDGPVRYGWDLPGVIGTAIGVALVALTLV